MEYCLFFLSLLGNMKTLDVQNTSRFKPNHLVHHTVKPHELMVVVWFIFLTGHNWIWSSNRQMSGTFRISLQQDQGQGRIRDGLWWKSRSCFFFFFVFLFHISAVAAAASSPCSRSLQLTWLTHSVRLLCVGWMPFLPLAASVMCCYYV